MGCTSFRQCFFNFYEKMKKNKREYGMIKLSRRKTGSGYKDGKTTYTQFK